VGEALDGAGVGVAGGADLDGGGAGQQELDRVLGVTMPPMPRMGMETALAVS
jgi:hypothetical protein